MKKTLIALAVATSAVVSGSVMASSWETGVFNGTVDIGGSVVKDSNENNWAWKVGDGLGNFTNKITELVDGTKLSIPMKSDQAILLGATTKAFSLPDSLGYKAAPQIEYTDANGQEVVVSADGSARDGKVLFNLPVKDDQNNDLGTVTVHATVAGVALGAKEGGKANLFSVMPNSVAFGKKVLANTVDNGESAVGITSLFGGMTKEALIQQLQTIDASAATNVVNYQSTNVYPTFRTSDNPLTSAGYALGVASGQTLDVVFNKELAETTTWKAPLTVSVSYQ